MATSDSSAHNTLKQKIDALKAEIIHGSISPERMGTLLDELASLSEADNKAMISQELNGSNNLVPSNAAVQDAINKVIQNTFPNAVEGDPAIKYEIQDLYPFFLDGYIPVSYGAYNLKSRDRSNSNYVCMALEVKTGDMFHIQNLHGGSKNGYSYGIYNSKGEKITDALLDNSNQDVYISNLTIIIKEDGYIVFNNQVSNRTCKIRATVSWFTWQNFLYPSLFNSINKNLEEIKSDLYGLEKSKSNIWDIGYIRTGGVGQVSFENVENLSNYRYKIIDCFPGQKFNVYVRGGSSGNARGWSFLDGNKVVLTQDAINSSDSFYELIAPDNAYYLVLNTSNSVDSYVEYIPVWKNNSNVGTSSKELKILCYGNSFTQDSMSYVPFILKNVAPELNLTLGIAYIGGCPLVQHYANFANKSELLDGTTYNPTNYLYQFSKFGDPWESKGYYNVDNLLKDECWDVITFQPQSGQSYGEWEKYYKPYIFKIHKLLFDKLDYPIKIGWLLIQGSRAGNPSEFKTHWEGVVENSKKIMEQTATDILFPYGTGLQNLRTTSLQNLGDGTYKNMSADNAHIQDGIGCLVCAYTNALKILELAGINNKGIIGDTLRPDIDFISQKNIPAPNLGSNGVIGITEDNCYMAQVAAELAIKYPYDLIDMEEIESNIKG